MNNRDSALIGAISQAKAAVAEARAKGLREDVIAAEGQRLIDDAETFIATGKIPADQMQMRELGDYSGKVGVSIEGLAVAEASKKRMRTNLDRRFYNRLMRQFRALIDAAENLEHELFARWEAS